MIEPSVMRQAKIDGRSIWHYLFQTTIGDLHIVQHETMNEMTLTDDYIGWSNTKADIAFDRMVTRMLRGRE